MRPGARELLAAADRRTTVPATDPPSGATIGDGIVVLDRVHRFGGAIAALADAVRGGDADAVIAALCGAPRRRGRGSPSTSPTPPPATRSTPSATAPSPPAAA